jgi:cytidylate kinase
MSQQGHGSWHGSIIDVAFENLVQVSHPIHPSRPGNLFQTHSIQDNAAVGELVVVTGPPGVGKSSVSEHLANGFNPSALVAGDGFFAMIKQGYILPWLPQARRQNTVVIESAAAAAGRLTDICTVVYDGVLGPWFLPTFVPATGLASVHYVILLPPLDVCLERVQGRIGHGFSDLSATRDLYEQFANAPIDSKHVITESHDHPAQLAELITRRLEDGYYRYALAGSGDFD